MKQRYLGDLKVSALGLGCMGMSEFYGEANEAESLAVLDYALDHGLNFFDTADMYGFGENERLLGKAFKGKRDQVIIATKFGILRDTNDPTYRGLDGRPEHVRKSVEGSLKRLSSDHIDLYYLHRVDPKVPISETIGAMSELVAEGKVRYIGLSEAAAKTIRKANSIHPITAVQTEYSMGSREVEENDVLKVTKELNIGFVAYSPLSRALLTNEFSLKENDHSDFRQNLPRFQTENLKKNQKITETLNEFSKNKGCTLAQLSLAWLLTRGEQVVPIPGTKRLSYLKENIAAASLELSAKELNELDNFLGKFQLEGMRYAPEVINDHNLNG